MSGEQSLGGDAQSCDRVTLNFWSPFLGRALSLLKCTFTFNARKRHSVRRAYGTQFITKVEAYVMTLYVYMCPEKTNLTFTQSNACLHEHYFYNITASEMRPFWTRHAGALHFNVENATDSLH